MRPWTSCGSSPRPSASGGSASPRRTDGVAVDDPSTPLANPGHARRVASTYRAPPWLAGGHAQTIYPFLLRRPTIRYRRERVPTPDDDFWDFDWHEPPHASPRAQRPVVAIFHGLEGNSGSHYVLALMQVLDALGWRGVVPHFRGCSGELNRRPRAYHSGDHEEIAAMLAALRERIEGAPLHAVGVSLGGSALLNWLGRAGASAGTSLATAAAVSAPIDLTSAGRAIGQGLNRLYTYHFLQTLLPKSRAMVRQHPGLFDPARLGAVRSMFEFDDLVTAPLHGFASVEDYWRRASCKPWLRGIRLPTLVLNARNDPFVPAASLPGADEASDSVTLEQPEGGGHVGFLAGRFPGRLDWLPRRLLQFFRDPV